MTDAERNRAVAEIAGTRSTKVYQTAPHRDAGQLAAIPAEIRETLVEACRICAWDYANTAAEERYAAAREWLEGRKSDPPPG